MGITIGNDYNQYKGLKPITDLRQSQLYRDVTNFGAPEQFNIYTSGHPYLALVSLPAYLEKLKEKYKATFENMIDNAIYIMEREFKGIDGLDDITTETAEFNDGFNTVNMINKVLRTSASTVSMRYNEKAGQPLTKFLEMYLRGIYDPDSHFKHYHGLIADGTITDPGIDKEVFTFLYYVTDTTGLKVEAAYLLFMGQFPKAETSIHNATKGEHEAKELSIELNCVPVRNWQATELANRHIENMKAIITRNSADEYRTEKNDAMYGGPSGIVTTNPYLAVPTKK